MSFKYQKSHEYFAKIRSYTAGDGSNGSNGYNCKNYVHAEAKCHHCDDSILVHVDAVPSNIHNDLMKEKDEIINQLESRQQEIECYVEHRSWCLGNDECCTCGLLKLTNIDA